MAPSLAELAKVLGYDALDELVGVGYGWELHQIASDFKPGCECSYLPS